MHASGRGEFGAFAPDARIAPDQVEHIEHRVMIS